MKADVGNLLFIKDKIDANKRRPFMCMHVFTNKAGVPYNWLIVPITSKDSVGQENLVEITHVKLATKSYAKINNLECISWNDDIEIATKKFAKECTNAVSDKLGSLFTRK